MLKQKKYFYLNLFVLSIFISIGIGLNYFIDSYGIFKNNFDSQILEPNQNYIKTKYILNNKEKYDSFIFGSSRVGNIPIENIKNGKYYNMTYSEGVPNEWLETIKIFLKNDIKIKNIILGLDDFSFKVDPSNHFNQPMRMSYNLIEKNNLLLKTYLLKNPFDKYNLLTLKKLMSNEELGYEFDIENSGRPLNLKKEFEIEKNKEAHVKDSKFQIPTSYPEFSRVSETLIELSEIKKICDNKRISLIVFFNPLHEATLLSNDLEEFEKIKKMVSQINPIYDFATLSEITTNNYYWYETSHYRPIVGEIIAKIIQGEKSNNEHKLNKVY